MTARYALFETGPDNRSTYAECWGCQSTSPGRLVAESETLAGLLAAVDGMGHDNWWIRGPGGRNIASSRREYYARPSVAKGLTRLCRLE
jgi:hypothetical protein